MSQDITIQLKNHLRAQHPIAAAYAEVFEMMGGIQGMLNWAQENPTKFYQMMPKFAPSLAPTTAVNGDVNIRVHHELKPSPLDDLDADYEEVK